MKIIQIIPNLDPAGAETFVVNLSNELSKRHDVILISLFKNKEFNHLVNDSLSDKVKFYEFDKKLGFDLRMVFHLYKQIKIDKPDIVNTHLRALGYILFLVLFFPKVKFYHTIHNDAFKESNGVFLPLRKFIFRFRLVKVITISEESNKSYQLCYKLDNAEMIYNGTIQCKPTKLFDNAKSEIDRLRITDKTKVILNVGRISEQKNQIRLVKVVMELIDEGYDVSLAIIGGIKDIEIYDQLSKYKSDRINLLGFKSNPTDYYRLVDCFCLSSDYEGMPISLIEAFASRCIAISTPAGGVKDMLNNTNGFLAEDFTEAKLKETFVKYFNSSDLASYQDEAYSDFLKKYSIEKTASDYEKYYSLNK